MKSPLRYQLTEYDSGATAILNGISYICDRENINPNLVSAVYRYALDTANANVKPQNDDYSSKAIMSFITKNIDTYNKGAKIKLELRKMAIKDLTVDAIESCARLGGATIIPIYSKLTATRFVTVTNAEDGKIMLFDPYFIPDESEIWEVEKDIINVTDKPFEYNRIIRSDRLEAKEIPYSLSTFKDDECYFLFASDNTKPVSYASNFDYIFETNPNF